MRFLKIKFSKGKVRLEYEVKSKKGDMDEFYIACSDEPRPEFKDALAALKTDVLNMCELPEDYLTRISVNGVSFSYGGDAEVMGATISASMSLRKSNVPLNLNTPHKPSEPYAESGDGADLLDDECVERLERLIEEAEEYVGGRRAQGELFDAKPKVEINGTPVGAIKGAEIPIDKLRDLDKGHPFYGKPKRSQIKRGAV